MLFISCLNFDDKSDQSSRDVTYVTESRCEKTRKSVFRKNPNGDLFNFGSAFSPEVKCS